MLKLKFIENLGLIILPGSNEGVWGFDDCKFEVVRLMAIDTDYLYVSVCIG